LKGFLQKLFGQEDPAAEKAAAPANSALQSNNISNAAAKFSLDPPQLLAACAQSVGMQRDHNEDALFALTTTLTSDHSNLPFGIYIVADGMGGHQHGEIASGIAIRSMASYIISKLFLPLVSVKPTTPQESLQEIMQTGVQEAHRSITKQVPGGGTTLTAALILGEQITIAHVGDSRAYLIDRQGNLEALTRDHTLVKRLVELGQLSHEEAAIHPQRNVLYRALGQGEPFDPDIKTLSLPESSSLLICSDGLWGVIPEEEISALVQSEAPPEQICQALIDRANAAGGPDNITAILVRLPG
jgi:serine/threonine protein phosphatase PrpC